jgi:hypothetical protein
MTRSLPSLEDAARILAAKRTRPPRRPPPSASRAVTRAIKSLDTRFGQGAEGLAAHWTEIVGKVLAARSEPGRLIKSRLGGGAVLELRVEGPSSVLIQHQAPDIIERANLFLGAGAVSGLRIVQRPLTKTARAKPGAGAASRRHKPPLDAAEEARLAADLAAFGDGPLKHALQRLGREVLRGSKT